MKTKARVAALQFSSGVDVRQNESTVLRMIDLASEQNPDLMVLPEFVNHASWYDNGDHCYEVALDLDGEFLEKVAAKAKDYHTYIVVNVTLRRGEKSCTGSSILFSRQGEVLAVSNKQVLMGHENDFLTRATEVTPIVDTDIGRLGLYACMDGVIAETPRDLALRGAQILCNSLNSFGLDEASLHIPVRAAENKVFVVAANKVGPLIPPEQIETVSQYTGIPQHFLYGAGESQILAPDGTVLVKASLANEEVIIADIVPSDADHKLRHDGLDIFASRRPELYQPIHSEPEALNFPEDLKPINAACWQSEETGQDAISEICQKLPQLSQDHQLVVLPELFFVADIESFPWEEGIGLSQSALQALLEASQGLSIDIVGSFLLEGKTGIQLCGVVINDGKVILKQAQLHKSARYEDQLELGDNIIPINRPYGKLAVILGDDAIYPETFRLAAIQGVNLVASPGHIMEAWEVQTGLMERAAENRICLAYASRPTTAGASVLADLHEDFTLLTPWQDRIFDGNINKPLITLGARYSGTYSAKLNLPVTSNKLLSGTTDVVASRPWNLRNSAISEEIRA